ncbi:hypothetical protein HMPREF0591_0232 [Mycobacterium parascrofulaceum ATCC BAA-614]|uniref:Uncharacterized protein n=1 Tax=Mycobacterium parascrofulaceum ATCC BAA-614 TaxID=525368 RepID=D5P238_9MYCO|nr:hypothetical protein HMPREF0591_0232 [Mycobacterium parascrofulaceum ATCC BAA-614]
MVTADTGRRGPTRGGSSTTNTDRRCWIGQDWQPPPGDLYCTSSTQPNSEQTVFSLDLTGLAETTRPPISFGCITHHESTPGLREVARGGDAAGK